MFYCPGNLSLLDPWIDHGFSRCFISTLSSLFLCCFITIAGSIQIHIYRKYATSLDLRLLRRKRLFSVQIVLHVLLPLLAIIYLALEVFVVNDGILFGYMLLSALLSLITWPTALYIVQLERHKALPSIPTGGHGLILLLFWTFVFINENLTFLNIKSPYWWFDFKSSSSKIEFAFFVLRYISSMLLFLIGFKAPGIPTVQDYFMFRELNIQIEQQSQYEEGRTSHSGNRSAFSDMWRKIKLLGPFLWPKKNILLQSRVILCFLILILGRVINVYGPLYSKKIVNSLSVDQSHIVFRWDYILTYVAFWFLQGQGSNSFLNNMRTFLWIRVQQYTVKEVEIELYQHLHSLSLRWHLSRKVGEVLRIMDRGTSSVSNLLSYIVFNIFPTFADIFIAVIYFALAFNIWFGAIVFLTMVLYLAATIAVTEWRTKYRRTMNKLDNAVEARCVDALLNFETVKYYCAESYETQRYRNAIDDYQKAEWISTATLSLLNVIQNSIITIGIMTGSLLCAHLVVTGNEFTVGDYVLFSTYILQLYTPLNYLGTYYRMIQAAFVDMENMFDLLNEKQEIIDYPDAVPFRFIEGKIEFRNVFFSYVTDRIVLKNISFTVLPGQTVALVGHTGSGKSTIVKLLFRFYDVAAGSIFIDGQDISKVTQASLRSCIGVVPQDTVLFNESIRYNIQYGMVTATDAEVEEAAKSADIHSSILTFPEGYDTIVGERGLKLSGGEKQRVAIARTILKNPAIIVLDEATSSLDTQTERNIQSALAKVCANKTTFIVAHSSGTSKMIAGNDIQYRNRKRYISAKDIPRWRVLLSTVVHADLILVLENGEIIERGSHEDLLSKGGVYSEMWQKQLNVAACGDDVNLVT